MRGNTLIFCLLIAIKGAYAGTLEFDTPIWDFGTIEETGGSLSYKFEFENTSSSPVVIHNIRTSCGCTTSEFSRKPIGAGKRSSFEVTFNPQFQPGVINKHVYIYSTASSTPLEVEIRGHVTPRTIPVEEYYPYALGGGARIASLYVTVAGLEADALSQSVVEFMNSSDRAIEVEFRPQRDEERLRLIYDPVLRGGDYVELNVGYYLESGLEGDERLRDTVEIYVNGERSNHRLFILGVGSEE